MSALGGGGQLDRRQRGGRRDHRRPLRQAGGRRQPGHPPEGVGLVRQRPVHAAFGAGPGSCSRIPAGTATTWRGGCCGRWPIGRPTGGRCSACRRSAGKAPAIRATSGPPPATCCGPLSSRPPIWRSFASRTPGPMRPSTSRTRPRPRRPSGRRNCSATGCGSRADKWPKEFDPAGGLRRCQQGQDRQAGRLLGDRVHGRRQGPAAVRRRHAGADSLGPDRPQDAGVLRREAARHGGHRGRAVPGIAGPRIPPAVRRAVRRCTGRSTR